MHSGQKIGGWYDHLVDAVFLTFTETLGNNWQLIDPKTLQTRHLGSGRTKCR